MWTLYQLAKTTRSRPSDLLAVADELAAYFLDKAVTVFGMAIENDIEKATQKKSGAAAERAANSVIAKWVVGDDGKADARRFRTPVATR
jgi:hypothetical protein